MIKELLIAFVVCLAIGAFINGMPPQTPTTEISTQAEQTQTADPSQSGDPATDEGSSSDLKAQETSDASFDEDVLKSDVPVLVDFSASWCQPCQLMSPIVDQLAKQYEGKVRVFKVDTDRNPDLKNKYQISALPTFMMFRGGRSVAQHSGAMPQEMLAGVIDRQLGTQ